MATAKTTVAKIKTVTRIICGPDIGHEEYCSIHLDPKGSHRRQRIANQIRLERQRQRGIWRIGGKCRGLNSVGMAGLRRA